MIVRRASAKLQEGDIRGAVRCLNSEESLAPWSDTTLLGLQSKHPPRPADSRSLPISSSPSMSVTANDIRIAIKSFSPGSAGGRDGLRPQHLKDMTENQIGVTLCEALCDFSNLVRAGKITETVRPAFLG